MSKDKLKGFSVFLAVVIMLSIPSLVMAAEQSAAPDANDIEISNYAGMKDQVIVRGLAAGDTVRVYASLKGATILGTIVSTGKEETVVNIAQLGTIAGEVYISVTNKGYLESDKVKVLYGAEEKTTISGEIGISIRNNVGVKDTVTVTGLHTGDVVKVYASEKGAAVLGSATSSGKAETVVSVAQLGTEADVAYVSVTQKGYLESNKAAVSYDAEGKTELGGISIVVSNNAGTNDKVTVSGLTAGDTVRIYADQTSPLLLRTTKATGSSAVLNVTQLKADGGTIYVTVTKIGKSESEREEVEYLAEQASNPLIDTDVDIVNNAREPDTITVAGLQKGETIKVYEDSATYAKLLGTATAAADGKAVVKVTQLDADGGSVYVSVIRNGSLESERIEKTYEPEAPGDVLDEKNVNIVNNAGKPDTVTVSGLKTGETIKVYKDNTETAALGTATAANGKAVVSIAQLGDGDGSVYVSVIRTGKLESPRVEVDYSAEEAGTGVTASNIITIVNNAGIPDTVTVTGLGAGDIIKVYDDNAASEALGTATAAGGKAVASIEQLGTGAGSVFVSVTRSGKLESGRTEQGYPAEGVSDALNAANIEVINNVGIPDKVTVTGLSIGDIIKVYEDDSVSTALGTATAAGGKAVASIEQLGEGAGSVYVSVTKSKKRESGRTEKGYLAEGNSDAPDSAYIEVANNAGKPDTVTVRGLEPGEVINVYNDAEPAVLLGTATVPTNSNRAVWSTEQLGTGGGSVYVSVQRKGKMESSKIKATYPAEGKTEKPADTNIKVSNNVRKKDEVYVESLTAGDTVKVYNNADPAVLLGTATVATGKYTVVVSIEQLGSAGGSVYVTVTKPAMQESDKVVKGYDAEGKSGTPAAGDITVANNVTAKDTVTVVNLSKGDIVKVYKDSTGSEILGTATASGNNVVVSIPQLGTENGTVYVTVTKQDMLESDRQSKGYSGEKQSDQPDGDKIVTINNKGTDFVFVYGLKARDVVKLYNAGSGGTAMASVTVAVGQTHVLISVKQLGETGGTVYISVTSTGNSESERTDKGFSAE